MKKLRLVLAGMAFILGFTFIVHAQETAPSDFDVELQALEQTTPIPASQLPESGTFWSAQHATDWPPLPSGFLNVPGWPLGDDVFVLDDLNVNYSAMAQTATRSRISSGIHAMDESGGGFSPDFSFPSNSLYLQINAVSNGLAYLNLMNATDSVYEIFSKTDLTLTNWNIEQEVWPTNTNSMPFTVQEAGRTNLFIWARDWTGITENGNTTPDWWFWEYFGTVAMSDTNLDSEGNTLLFDYEHGFYPNVISFSILATNNYVNNMSALLQLNVTAGVPSYVAVSVDDTNYVADANWQTYTGTNINVNLGLNQGWHDVWIGLQGFQAGAQQTWKWKRLKLDFTPPLLVITNPAVNVVSQPMIQLQGYSPEALSSISYDLTNADGLITNQQILVSDQYYDTNTWEFTTNYFQGYDIPLTNGLNTITLHATDLAGDVTTTNFNFTLDYSGKTNPPAFQLDWPTNGTQISGSSFTLDGSVSDFTATVTAQVVNTNGNTNVVAGLVERNGNFWVENLPLGSGTNALTLTVTDVAGNTSVTNISVIQSALVLTMNTVTNNLWQPTVNVNGTISDASYAVWVNNVKGTNYGNGTWSANNVPVTPGGTASFTVTAYAPGEQQPSGN